MTDVAPVAPPVWSTVRGQDAVVETLRTALVRDQVSHAWMLVGPPDVGQDAVARALAAALNCPEAGAPASEGCGACGICDRIAKDVHPASQTFLPEGTSHLVSGVRERWIPAATRSLVDGRVKVLRIGVADRMNEATQNAFLKILEEPPRTAAGATTVVWLLDVEDESALLDTIVSRCRRLTFRPWTPEVLGAFAEQQLGLPDGVRRQALVRAAMGSPRRLIELADADVSDLVDRLRAERDANPRRKKPTDEDLEEMRDQLSGERARRRHLELLRTLLDQGPAAAVPLARGVEAWARARVEVRKADNAAELAGYEDAFRGQGTRVEWPPGFKTQLEQRHKRTEREAKQEALAVALDEFASYLRDVVAAKSGAADQAIVHVDHLEAIRSDAARTPYPSLFWGLQAVSETREAFERNGAPSLHLERLFLGLAVRLSAAA
ncbi:MAG TPA: hypothetical protein VGA69_06205 [Nitriliruptorales bacterium]